MINRLRKFISFKNLSIRSFEKEINVSNELLSRAFNRGSDIKSGTLERIALRYPELNIRWLLTGEGKMLNDDRDTISVVNESTPSYGIDIKAEMIKSKDELIEQLKKRLADKEEIINMLRSQLTEQNNDTKKAI